MFMIRLFRTDTNLSSQSSRRNRTPRVATIVRRLDALGLILRRSLSFSDLGPWVVLACINTRVRPLLVVSLPALCCGKTAAEVPSTLYPQ